MIRSYSEDELLTIWLRARGVEVERADSVIARTDLPDIKEDERRKMRGRVAEMIDSADVRLLGTRDYRSVLEADGEGRIALPAGTRRVARVKLRSWEREAEIVSEGDRRVRDMENPAAVPGRWRPIGVHAGGELRLYPYGEGEEIERLELIVETEPAMWELDDRLVGEMVGE